MQELEINVPGHVEQSYRIVIGSDMIPSLWPQIKGTFATHHRFVITDANVAAAGHLDSLLGDRPVPHFIISPAGEISKSIDTAVAIVEARKRPTSAGTRW